MKIEAINFPCGCKATTLGGTVWELKHCKGHDHMKGIVREEHVPAPAPDPVARRLLATIKSALNDLEACEDAGYRTCDRELLESTILTLQDEVAKAESQLGQPPPDSVAWQSKFVVECLIARLNILSEYLKRMEPTIGDVEFDLQMKNLKHEVAEAKFQLGQPKKLEYRLDIDHNRPDEKEIIFIWFHGHVYMGHGDKGEGQKRVDAIAESLGMDCEIKKGQT